MILRRKSFVTEFKLRSAATSFFAVQRWAFDIRRLIFSIFLILFTSAACASDQTWFTVKWVNDGDTIVLTNGNRVRYIGINAPEIDHDRQKAQPYGYQAKSINTQLVLNRKIRLEFDQERHDRYGRLLAYIFLPDQTFLNEYLLQEGYAFFLFRKPNLKYSQRLLKAQREAMKYGKGMWSNWSEKKNQYVASRNSRRFHMQSCASARNINQRNRTYFETKWDAFKSGYAPAGGCIKEFWSYASKKD